MGAKYNSGKVTTIENLDVKARLAKVNFSKSGLDNIFLIEGDAIKAIPELGQSEFDFIFLDADKENYGKYFDLLVPKLKVGGFIVADNVFDYGHLMQDYLEKVLGTKLPGSTSDPRVKSYTLPIDNGLLITKKISN
jgi:predicted O-methyltransferase YrrM